MYLHKDILVQFILAKLVPYIGIRYAYHIVYMLTVRILSLLIIFQDF